MGWEIWTKQERYPPSQHFPKGYVKTRMGFFCISGDKSFGPVLYIGERWRGANEKDIRNQFYKAFSQAAKELHDPDSLNGAGKPKGEWTDFWVDARCYEGNRVHLRKIAQRAIEIMEAYGVEVTA